MFESYGCPNRMEDSHYDEFGNYIGPALSDSDQVSSRGTAAAHVACDAFKAEMKGASATTNRSEAYDLGPEQ